MKFKRSYMVGYSWPGTCWEEHNIKTNMRIRTAVLVMFRKWYGRSPTSYWHKDGFMAEAWDKRGNRVELQQKNHFCPFLGPLPVIKRPCWALERRAA
jgi:hypothetical protein